MRDTRRLILDHSRLSRLRPFPASKSKHPASAADTYPDVHNLGLPSKTRPLFPQKSSANPHSNVQFGRIQPVTN